MMCTDTVAFLYFFELPEKRGRAIAIASQAEKLLSHDQARPLPLPIAPHSRTLSTRFGPRANRAVGCFGSRVSSRS